MMQFEIDTVARSAYLRIKRGRVSSTRGLSDVVCVDVDRNGTVLGVEFIGLNAFETSADLVSSVTDIAAEIVYSVDGGKQFEVDALAKDQTAGGGATRLHLAFVEQILSGAQSVNDIPDGAQIAIVESRGVQTTTVTKRLIQNGVQHEIEVRLRLAG